MIPVSLKIKGLYSYQEEQTIDFKKLTGSHIFGIFGKVGSGKSSILEAITFALYGRTDRLNLKGDNRNYNMLNLKSSDMLIDFNFESAKNGEYRIICKARRNSKRFEDVGAIDRTAYVKKENEWEPVSVDEIPQIIGLSYENFKRTVIIPQGRFQEFLQLNPADRTQMMKELFHLNRFDLYQNAARVDAGNARKIQFVEGQLQQIGEVNSEQLKVLEDKMQSLSETLKKNLEEQEVLQSNDQLLNDLKELFLKLQELQRKFNEYEAKKPEIELIEKNLKEYEICLTEFKPLLQQIDDIKEQARVTEASVHSLKKEKDFNTNALKVQKDELEKLEVEHRKINNYQNQLLDLKSFVKVCEFEQTNKALKERIKKGEERVRFEEDNVQKNNDLVMLSETKLEQLKIAVQDLSALNEVKNWHIHKNGYADQLIQQENDYKELLSTEKKYEADLNDLKSNDVLKEARPDLTSAGYVHYLEEKRLCFDKEISELDKKREYLIVQQKLNQYADNLKHGEACPLCGSKDHPDILNGKDISKDILEINNLKTQINQSCKLIDRLIPGFQNYNSHFLDLQKRKHAIDKRKKEIQLLVDKHENTFVWEQFRNHTYEKLNKQLEHANSNNKLITEEEKQLKIQRVSLHEYQKKLETYKLAINEFIQTLKANEQTIYLLLGQLNELNYSDYSEFTIAELGEKCICLEKYIEEVQNKHSLIGNEIKEKENRLSVVTGKLDSEVKRLNELKNRQVSQNEELNSRISYSIFNSLESVQSVLKQGFNIDVQRDRVEVFKRELFAIEQQYKSLNKELGGKSYNSERHQTIKNKLKELNGLISEVQKSLGELNNQISKLKEALLKQKDLLIEKDTLLKKEENLKLLKKLFKGGGFVKYVSTVRLQNICDAANERFYKLTGQKLHLELNDENNFVVRDFLNGGNLRSVKTLSGGQMFQASLSLALALVDNIQLESGSSHNFFFLDEGFGALDKDSLSVVFESLKSLRKENRIVGVISHVEELQQEISVHLKVENRENTGSLILTSW